MIFRKKLGIGIALALSAAACGDLGDKNKAPEDAREGARNIIAGINIVGTEWESPCAETELFEKSVREKYDFDVDNVTKSWVVYDDAECSDDIASISFYDEYKLKHKNNKFRARLAITRETLRAEKEETDRPDKRHE